MRRIVLIIASILVSAFFLWLALRGVPFDDVMNSIKGADAFWVAMTFLLTTGALATRAVRWQGLLDFRIALRESFHCINITFLLNQLPLRAGEVARSLLATRSGVPVMTAATSIIVERLVDTLLVVILLTVSVANLPDVPDSVPQTSFAFGIVAVIGFGVLVFFARYPDIAHKLLHVVQGILPFLRRLPLENLLDHVLDGLKPLTRWRSATHAVVWSLIAWSFSLVAFYALHRALNIEGVNLWLSSALAVSLASFSIAIPVSVASIGPFEAAVVLTGNLVGINPEVALALGFLAHGVTIIAYALWGMIGMVSMGVSIGDVFRAADEEQPKTAAE